MNLDRRQQLGLLIGALIGALLGAGAAYLFLSDQPEAEVPPLTAKDLLGLTSTAAALVRKLDDVRRKV